MDEEQFEKSLKNDIRVKIQKKHFIDFVQNHYDFDEYFDYTLNQLNNNEHRWFNNTKHSLQSLLKMNKDEIISFYYKGFIQLI